MRLALSFAASCVLLAGLVSVAVADEAEDEAFQEQMLRRKLPTPQTLDDLANQVARMKKFGASNSEIAERMSVVIDKRLTATNKPQNESLFNPLREGAKKERDRKLKELDDYMTGNDGLAGKPINNGRKGAGLAELAWKHEVGNCSESANIAFEVLRRAGIPARIYNASVGGAHEFVVVGLSPKANPSDPSTWGEDARVVDGWIGRSLTPEEALANPHIFNGKLTNEKGVPRVHDGTDSFYDPAQEKKYNELGLKGYLAVTVKDDKGAAVPGATVRIVGEPPVEMISTGQGLATMLSYPGKTYVEVTPPAKLKLKSGRGSATIESKRSVPLEITLEKKPSDFKVAITSPANGSKVQRPELEITGTVSDPEVDKVLVGPPGAALTVAVENGQFSATVKLKKGENVLLAIAEQTTSDPVTVTLAQRTAWDGTWKGKLREVTTANGSSSTKNEDYTLEIVQSGDTLNLKGGKVAMTFKIDPKVPEIATRVDITNPPDNATTRNFKVKHDMTLTLRDGRLHFHSVGDVSWEARPSEKDAWKRYTSQGDSSGAFDRQE